MAEGSMLQLPMSADSTSSKQEVTHKQEEQCIGPPIRPVSRAVNKQVSLTNSLINKMKKQEIRNKLAELKLDTRGHKDVLKKRLKTYFKNRRLAEAKMKKKPHPHYDYFLVIDFEATCDTHNPEDFNHEIIEFPVLLINTRSIKVEDEFHSYVKPTVNQKLTDFCKKLTGITQEQVDSAPTFDIVLDEMTKWMASHKLGTKKTFAVITDGPWDMSRFMYLQCQTSHIPMPEWSQRWVNLRKSFCNFYGVRRTKLGMMLEVLGLTFEGQPHSGLDDTRNISRIVLHMLQDGAELRPNEELFHNKLNKNRALFGPLKKEDIVNDGESEEDQVEEQVEDEQEQISGVNEDVEDGTTEKNKKDISDKWHCGRSKKQKSIVVDKVDNLVDGVQELCIDTDQYLMEDIDDLLSYYKIQKS